MAGLTKEELLKIPQVVEEVKRHLWIESEQAGYNIGFDNAADDWIKKYSIEWLKYYMPEKVKDSKETKAPKEEKKAPATKMVSSPAPAVEPSAVKKSVAGTPAAKKTAKKRSAKTYKRS